MTLDLTKVKLEKKGDERILGSNEAHATLFWKTEVDLDLYGIARPKTNAPAQKKGFFGKLASAVGLSEDDKTSSGEVQVNYQNRSRMKRESFPFITLDQDAGIGDKVESVGYNEENMHFFNISAHDHILIVANIYGKDTNFAQYEGGVTIKCGNEEIYVPLTEQSTGSWCTRRSAYRASRARWPRRRVG